MTFSASANPITYQGATPVFIDSEPDTWNLDPAVLKKVLDERRGSNGQWLTANGHPPKAIIPVHLYGMPAKMNEIMEVANRYEIPVIEDAAEALGAKYVGEHVGHKGTMTVLSEGPETAPSGLCVFCMVFLGMLSPP